MGIVRLACIGLLFVCVNVVAKPPLTGKAREDALGACDATAVTARLVMRDRQQGGSISTELAKYPGQKGGAPEMRQLIMDSYEVPLQDSQAARQRVIDDFQNRTYARCYKQRLGG